MILKRRGILQNFNPTYDEDNSIIDAESGFWFFDDIDGFDPELDINGDRWMPIPEDNAA